MFEIDSMSRIPVYEQIISQAEKYIAMGILNAGDKLPSVRSLSIDISVNPNTIQKAYGELDSKGIIVTVPGKGCFVSENAMSVLRERALGRLPELQRLVTELIAAGINADEIMGAVSKAIERKD